MCFSWHVSVEVSGGEMCEIHVFAKGGELRVCDLSFSCAGVA